MTAKSNKVVPGKDETASGAEEINGQLINATGFRENADHATEQPDAETGDKNRKTTEGTIAGKEKSKNRREASLDEDKKSKS